MGSSSLPHSASLKGSVGSFSHTEVHPLMSWHSHVGTGPKQSSVLLGSIIPGKRRDMVPAPHFTVIRMPGEGLGTLPWSWGSPEDHRRVRSQAHNSGLMQQRSAHQEGLQLPPGPPGRAGWAPSSSQGCSLGHCASAPPSCCGTRPQYMLQREDRHRP